MKICIQLAKIGEGKTSPNPLVGCIVLDNEGREVARGYHHKYGEYHAERDALLKIDKNIGHTLVVNLEPCSHFGKTPPCTDIIIEKGIKRVVVGMRDVNPKVSGINKLKSAGIEVIENVLHQECLELNEIFIKNMKEKKPFVAIKTATTLDGKIATQSGSSKWITSEKSREEVKKIRNRYDAIMTSSNTIIADNPSMEHKNKIILDRNLKCDLSSKIYQTGNIYIFYDTNVILSSAPAIGGAGEEAHNNITFVPTPIKNGKLDLDFVFQKAYELGIYSILVESGGHLNGSVLNFADKIYHFIAPKITCDNTSLSCFDGSLITDISECKNFEIRHIKTFEPDILLEYYPCTFDLLG